ncbi:immunoglobulin mu heavy chain, partial [Clarias magur]
MYRDVLETAALCNWAFDYWGKGTAVTVTSATQEAPKSLFPVWQCGSSPDGFVTLGCVTRDLATADGLSYVWKDASGTALTTNVVQYPAVIDSGKYSSVSQARVSAADWDANKKFTCEVTNSLGTKTAPLQKPVVPDIPAKSLLLTAPSQTELENGTAIFICLASEFSPKTFTFKWTRGATSLDNKAKAPILIAGKPTYSSFSVLQLTAAEWMGSSSPIKCEFQQKSQTLSKEASYVSCDQEQPKITIIPPSNNAILIKKSGDLVCKAEGPMGFTGIKWIANGKELASLPEKVVSTKAEISLTTSISYEEWHKGTTFTCEVHHSSFAQGFITEVYKKENGRTPICPEFFLLPPPESSNENTKTLTCYIKNFYPKEVAVSWLIGNKPVDSESITKVIEKNGNFSAYSQLIVNKEEWGNGTTFTCNVYHESILESVHHISRSLAGNSNPPSLVNLSLNVPQNCPNPEYLVLTDLYNETEIDDDNVATTALTFVFLFLITLFYSIGVTVIKPRISWLVDGNQKSDLAIKRERQGESTVSKLTISAEDWTKWKTITCRAEHPCFQTIEDEIKTTEPEQKTLTVEIRRSLADVGKRDSAVLECVASGLPSGELSVTFQANDEKFPEAQYVNLPEGQDTLIARFAIPKMNQTKNNRFTCQIQLSRSLKWKSNSTGKLFESKPPTIRIRSPSDDELAGSNDTALLCLIEGFLPADISVHWELDNVKLDASRFKNSGPVRFASGSYSMQSALILSPLKKENGTFSCVVRHQSSTDLIKSEISNLY